MIFRLVVPAAWIVIIGMAFVRALCVVQHCGVLGSLRLAVVVDPRGCGQQRMKTKDDCQRWRSAAESVGGRMTKGWHF